MGNFLVGVLNYLIRGLAAFLTVITSWLPKSPFTLLSTSPISSYLGFINYVVPLDFIISTGETWLIAIGTFYLYQTVLRWIKAVD